jgi:hypothetical protein
MLLFISGETIRISKLVVKRFYDACQNCSLTTFNPAKGIKAPIENTDEVLNICYLELNDSKININNYANYY